MSSHPKLTLYTAPQSRGFMVAWLLEELGVPYDAVVLDLSAGEHKAAWYLDIHPLGSVPALAVQGRVILESLAICLWLADAYPAAGLAPSLNAPERAEFLQWMVYATATIEPALSKPFVRSLGMPPAARRSTATSQERSQFDRVLAPLAGRFAEGFVASNRMTAADIVVSGELYWAGQVGLMDRHSTAWSYLSRHRQRDAFERAQRLTG